ncbi:MAG: hypothetical protein WCA04_02270 [Geobacteraceae bacterium]
MVHVIYDSVTTVVVAYLSIEVVTIILLFGAQVIAEREIQPAEPAGKKHPGFQI